MTVRDAAPAKTARPRPALEAVAARLVGAVVTGARPETTTTTAPFTGGPLAELPLSTPADVATAYDVADAAVLPPQLRARVVVEAGTPFGWHDVAGDAGRIVGIDHFGASADAATLFREYGFTPENVVSAARESLAAFATVSGGSR